MQHSGIIKEIAKTMPRI